MATSNFCTQKKFNLWAADFSLPLYPTDDNGDEIPGADPCDFMFDDESYNEAEQRVDTLNKSLNFYKIGLKDGYYCGTQLYIDDSETPDEYYIERYFDFSDYGVNRYVLRRMIQAERNRINNVLLPLFKDFGFSQYGISARFSSGETWYSKIA